MLFAVMTTVIVTSAEANVIYVDANATTDASAGVYKTFEEAVAAATAGTHQAQGTTIKFLSDYTNPSTSSGLTINKRNLTIDLNGHAVNAVSRGFDLKGIGIQIGVQDGKLTVIAPIEDTPAEKAGLLAGDEILSIDGKSTKGLSVDKAADRIRGEEGTTVTLLIKRKGQPNKLYKITRAEIELKSVSDKFPFENTKLNSSIGYIRLSSFISRNAASEFLQALQKNENKQGYIIDLRSNPGGLLNNAIIISDMLLNGGVIVSTVDRDGYKNTTRSTRKFVTNKPIVVLINKGSASASEILSGALKDNERALLVGEKSFGKGLVQEINKLYDGAGLNITIQKYLTPNGTDINKLGIEPNYEVKITKNDIKQHKDPQLEKAKYLIKERLEHEATEQELSTLPN